jgi:hypothetical protein
MDKFHFLVDSSFNLLKASENSQEELKQLISDVYHKTKFLEETSKNIEDRISHAVNISSKASTEKIVNEILSNLSEAEKKAIRASDTYERAAKFSIFKIGFMFFLFFLMTGALLWLLFIPTSNEIKELRSERDDLVSDVAQLKKFGNITTCGNNKLCIKVNINQAYGEKEPYYYVIIPKK